MPNNSFNMNNINLSIIQFLNNFIQLMNINNLMNSINANPFLFQNINNLQNNNNINNNNFNINQGNVNITQNGILPTNIESNDEKNKTFLLCPKKGGKRSKITFTAGTGIKTNVSAPVNLKVKDLFVEYVKKIGLQSSVLGKKILFLYNGIQIDINESKTISEYGLDKSDSNILVVDKSSLTEIK